MNDVLAKPFTRDGMVRILKKHLSYMLKDPSQAVGLPTDDVGGGVQQTAGGPQGFGGPGGMAMATMGPAGVKFEQTPIQSPTTTASWHSPGPGGGGGQMQTSPTMDGSGGYMSAQQMVLTPGGAHRPQYAGQPQPQQMVGGMVAGLVGGEDRPEKRPRLYGPGPVQGAYVG